MRFGPMGLALAIWIVPMVANAQLTVEMSNIRCEQYLAMTPSQSRDFSSWMSGWFSYQIRKTTVDLLAHEIECKSVVPIPPERDRDVRSAKCDGPEINAGNIGESS